MNLFAHIRASRTLPSLLDDALDPVERERLEAHVAACRRCARRLDRLERSEALLARMPRGLFPLEAVATVAPARRLVTLSHWGERPDRQSPYGPLPAMSAVAVAALVLVLSVTAPEWGSVVVGDMGASTTVASVMPDSSFYPMTLR